MSIVKLQSEYDDLDKYNHYGDIYYYKKGTHTYHNPYGPATLFQGGYKAYLIEGQWHRLDGPARIWPDGYTEYWINDEELSKEKFEKHPERLKYLGKGHLICLI